MTGGPLAARQAAVENTSPERAAKTRAILIRKQRDGLLRLIADAVEARDWEHLGLTPGEWLTQVYAVSNAKKAARRRLVAALNEHGLTLTDVTGSR